MVIAHNNASAHAPDDPAQALDAIVHASFDWNHHVEVESGENSAAGDKPFFSDVSRVGDVWLLRQRAVDSDWRRFGMVVRHRRVYFATLDHTPALLGAECAECHPDGPRAIRGALRAGTEADRAAMNALVSNVHLTPLYYLPSEPARATAPLIVAPCTNCHDGHHRTWLTGFNHRAIRYQLEHAEVPPHSRFTDDERQPVLDWLNHH